MELEQELKINANDVISQIPQSKQKFKYYYNRYVNPLAWTLEDYMLKNNINEIGTLEKSTRFAENDKLLGINMSSEDRCLRSFYVKFSYVTLEQLSKWHEIEGRHWCFYYFFQIKNLIDSDFVVPDLKYGDKFLSVMKKFNYKYQPQFKKFKGMPIPPYFIYDLEFNGMEYHHQLDRNILNSAEIIDMSELYSRGSKSNDKFKPKTD